jgi:hypothetical protein
VPAGFASSRFSAPCRLSGSAEVFDLLVVVPKVGPVKAGGLLTVARISPYTTVGDLSERQRTHLIELLSR